MKKSILALLLAVLMVASLLPAAALADGTATMSVEELRDELSTAAAGSTVELTGNVTVSNNDGTPYTASVITVPEGVTLDGKGFSIIADDSRVQKDKGGSPVNANHILGVSNGSTVQNLTIIGANKT